MKLSRNSRAGTYIEPERVVPGDVVKGIWEQNKINFVLSPEQSAAAKISFYPRADNLEAVRELVDYSFQL